MKNTTTDEYDTDYSIGQDNVRPMGMDFHNPVFVICTLLILIFVIATLIFPVEAKTALDGAKQILMDQYAENAELLAVLREYLYDNAYMLSS